jgi:sulfoxide reductase catalytic subunit YedY
MHILRRPGWWLPENTATPEAVYLNRRRFLAASGAGIAAAGLLPAAAAAQGAADPSAGLYPFARNEKYKLDRAITPEPINANYNNFYEFGSFKRVAAAAQALKIRPWTVKIEGMVEKPFEIAIDELLAKMPREERLYRHRCVEAWAMAVPWSGFPMRALLDLARPLGSARFVEMKTFLDPATASGQRQTWYPWPYTEGVTISEAANELAFLVTGAYGKPMAKQFGAPLRLALPWKYGFKHIKSIVSFNFTDKRPKSFWEALQPSEYGFWANVNPEVPHPRWSQATEEVLGTNERVPTKLFNGYGEYVADLYKGLESERLWA